jgi:DNA replication protein DnaC
MNGKKRPAAKVLADILSSGGLLVLDDAGREVSTAWARERIFELTCTRYDQVAPLILTSNLSPPELVARGYDAILSRIHDGGRVLWLRSASDYRLRAGR